MIYHRFNRFMYSWFVMGMRMHQKTTGKQSWNSRFPRTEVAVCFDRLPELLRDLCPPTIRA